jgi:hypothetical protein
MGGSTVTTRKYTITDPTDGHTVIYDGTSPWIMLENGMYPDTVVTFDDTDRTFHGTAFIQGADRDDFEFVSAQSHYEFDRRIAEFYSAVTADNLFASARVVDYGVNSATLIVTRHDGVVIAVCDHEGWMPDELGFDDAEYVARSGLAIMQVTTEGDNAEYAGRSVHVPTYSPGDLVHAIGTY